MRKSTSGSKGAVWDNNITSIFCDVCLKEVEAGNRPTTCLNKEGWLNVKCNFKEQTGREYTRVQLKNKWDQLKKDWKIWKDLKKGSTGLGWDPKKKTIAASDEWWKEKLEVIPLARKFRYAGIDPELESKLDKMFVGAAATGADTWGLGVFGGSSAHNLNDIDEIEESNDLNIDASPIIFSKTQSSGSKRSCPSVSKSDLRKKGTTFFMKDHISSLLSACSKLSAGDTSKTANVDETISLLQSMPEVMNDQALFHHSVDILEDPTKRAIFIALAHENREPYLRHQFQNRSNFSSPSKG